LKLSFGIAEEGESRDFVLRELFGDFEAESTAGSREKDLGHGFGREVNELIMTFFGNTQDPTLHGFTLYGFTMKFHHFLGLLICWFPVKTIAQVTPIGNTVVTPNGATRTITGGTVSIDGKNLFHRFDQFNLINGQRALFEPGNAVRNVFSRITQASMIDGLVQMNGNANLFLINPSGILFGSNARLNLNGNFFATTAAGVGFQGGIWTGENDIRSLTGDPNSFVFGSGLPSGIVNAATLENQGTIALVGGQVANTGTLRAGQVAIVAVPGSQRVQMGDVNGVLKFEFQPLVGQTVDQTLQNWTPNSLSDLIAQGKSLNHGTQLETLPDGSVRVVGSSVTIGNGPQSVLVSGTIAGGVSQIVGDQVVLDRVRFETSLNTGKLLVNAERSLFLGGGNSSLNFGRGEAVTLRAGESIIAGANVLSEERDLVFQSPVIKTQLVDTAIAGNTVGGAIRMEGLNGQSAGAIGFSNLVTPKRDVVLKGDRVAGQFVITNATTSGIPGLQAGKVAIEGASFIGIGGAITSGRSVNLNTTGLNGTVQSGLIMTNGGDISLTGGRVNGGALWSSARENNTTGGNAGNVLVNAAGKLTTDRVQANGKDAGRSGDVVLWNERGDVVVDSVQAFGGVGGTVLLSGDRVRVTGSALDGVSQPYTFSSIHAGERVEIVHQGGLLNEDFGVGSSAGNGTNDRIVVGGEVLNRGAFAVRSQTQTDRPLTGLKITAVNSVPKFAGVERGFPVVVMPGVTRSFTLAGLGLPLPKDAEGDRVRVYLRPKPGAREGQLFLASGLRVTGAVEVTLSDPLVYRPSRNISATILDEYEIVPLDLPLGTIAEAQRIPLVFTTPVIPQQEVIAAPEPIRQAALPENSGMSNVTLSEIATMDKALSKDFEAMADGAEGTVVASLDGSLMREIEQKTGAHPAIVYVRTLRRSEATETDSLELTVLTSRGRFRRRVAIDATLLDAEVTKFRKEVTNPIRTHTTSYLPMAQKLHSWLIAPILPDLKTQGITNLVFIPEAGLRGIPYAALHDGKQFLVEQYSVALMPSLGLVKTGYRNLRNSSVLSIGISQSTQGQSALPMVEPEVATVSKLWGNTASYLNDRATLDLLQGAKQRHPFQILHLATHANFVPGKAKEAYVQLWNDRLRLDQLRQLDWNKPTIDLMVLSACKTAVGDRDSELGFAGLALQAGVKTAVASLWSVNDTATMGLIGEFYGRLLVSPVKAEALRSAQVAMLRGDLRIQDGKLVGFQNRMTVSLPQGAAGGDLVFRHPYYWAAFTMVGSPW
jgi:filamentous hemagglutinin family protein